VFAFYVSSFSDCTSMALIIRHIGFNKTPFLVLWLLPWALTLIST
jgi:hypothetical protein